MQFKPIIKGVNSENEKQANAISILNKADNITKLKKKQWGRIPSDVHAFIFTQVTKRKY